MKLDSIKVMDDKSKKKSVSTKKDNISQPKSVKQESSKTQVKNNKKIKKTRSLKNIDRIPWREYLRSQIKIIFGAIFVFILLIIIIDLSTEISQDRITNDNPDNVLTSKGLDHKLLIILPTIIYFMVIIFFLKLVFFDHREDFGITTLKSTKAILLFTLTLVFITLVFILFDIALINIYLLISPMLALFTIDQSIDIPFLNLREADIAVRNRKLYSDIRGFTFSVLFVFMIIIPLTLTVSILARVTKTSLNIKKLEPKKKFTALEWTRFLGVIPIEGFLIFFYLLIAEQNPAIPIHLLLIPLIAIVGIWWAVMFLIIVFRSLRYTSWLFYSNAAVVFLIVLLFYVFPAILWTSYDVYLIVTTKEIANTVYDTQGITLFKPSTPIIMSNLSSYVFGGLFILRLFFYTFLFNLASILRILELDFVIIIGLSSIVIGFAEGYSIISILKSLYFGASISKSGVVATRSSPRVMVLLSRSVYLLAWFTLAWDKFIVIWDTLTIKLKLSFLPVINFPRIFELLFTLTIKLAIIGKIFFVISILVFPLYFVIRSSFKFLSVTLVAEKIKGDNRTFFYLISSAFILIVSNILADISELPVFLGVNGRYLPFRGVATEELLPFVSGIFEVFEAVGFVAGLILSIYYLIKTVVKKVI